VAVSFLLEQKKKGGCDQLLWRGTIEGEQKWVMGQGRVSSVRGISGFGKVWTLPEGEPGRSTLTVEEGYRLGEEDTPEGEDVGNLLGRNFFAEEKLCKVWCRNCSGKKYLNLQTRAPKQIGPPQVKDGSF